MKDKHIGFLAMVVASLGLAVAVILMKVIPQVTQMPPQHVAIWRFALATPPLWAYLSLQRRSRQMNFRRPWPFLGLGLIYSIASFSAIFALQRLPSSIYVILIYIYPSLVVLYALLSGRSVPRLFWLGLPLTLLGLFLTTFEFGAALTIDPIGLVITMINALALAVYMLLSEMVFKKLDEPILGTVGVLSGAMLVGLSLIPFLGISTPNTIEGWVLLVSFGIFGTLMPIVAMNISLKKIGAARGSLIITLQPVLTILMALIFLNETLTFQQWVGGGLVILTIILLQRSPDRVLKNHQRKAGSTLSDIKKISTEEV
jgi:drug/metabolite transporter (DMT)-like permease